VHVERVAGDGAGERHLKRDAGEQVCLVGKRKALHHVVDVSLCAGEGGVRGTAVPMRTFPELCMGVPCPSNKRSLYCCAAAAPTNAYTSSSQVVFMALVCLHSLSAASPARASYPRAASLCRPSMGGLAGVVAGDRVRRAGGRARRRPIEEHS
jgi:hypothetical protein